MVACRHLRARTPAEFARKEPFGRHVARAAKSPKELHVGPVIPVGAEDQGRSVAGKADNVPL